MADRGSTRAKLHIAVGVATAGRRELATATVADLARQSRQPDQVLVCPAQPDDIDAGVLAELACPVSIVEGGRGLTRQRNAILGASAGADVIVFIDDDFMAHSSYLARVEDLFAVHPEVCVATGRLLADGIHGAGYSADQARALLALAKPAQVLALRDTYGGYGCNMAFRMSGVERAGARFDERLPLYGWQEDIDFSRQVAACGRIVQCDALIGVHLGSKSGRQSGLRFGYSQVANPLYLWSKGTMSARYAAGLMARNLLANLARLAWAEPHVDRRGRVRGNLLAVVDGLRGRLRPERILELGA